MQLKKFLPDLMYTVTPLKLLPVGQSTDRQTAKAHTLRPLRGNGVGRTPAEAKYYEHFTEKYKEIGVWHSRLAKEAINTQKISTPSGREFAFPNVVRKSNGRVTNLPD